MSPKGSRQTSRNWLAVVHEGNPVTGFSVLLKLLITTTGLVVSKLPLMTSSGHGLVTVTLNWQVLVLPHLSFAVQVTTVWPMGKNEPDGSAQFTGTGPSQLSRAVGKG